MLHAHLQSGPRPLLDRRPLWLLLVAVVLLSGMASLSHAQTASATARAGGKTRPNVLLITTDDQTLTDLAHMPRTRRLIADQGVSFDGISNHPLCCPARAEILTGQFAQNNGVRSNRGPYGGYKRLHTRNTIATWMQDAGYHTIFMGKFLNGYNAQADTGHAPGWDDWNPTVRGVYNYDHFTVRHNDRQRTYNKYQTDVFTDLAVQKIRKASNAKRPFFLWQSYMAPHASCPPTKETETCWSPPKPAPRHRGMFSDAVPPSMSSPAFNEADTTDKPFPLRRLPELDRATTRKIVALHRRRLESLQAVDQGVASMLRTLKRTGELRNTLVIFTSDNGYLLGEHRYAGKVMPYEESLKVPLLMRGPGIPHGVVRKSIGTLVDLAPTIVAAGRAKPTLVVDGHNLLPAARRRAPSWETLLIQAGPYRPRDDAFGWFYRGVRTDRYTYAHYLFSDEDELYDRRNDPFQLDNLAQDPDYAKVLAALKRRTAALRGCAGQRCFRSFPALPAPLKQAPAEPTPTDPGSSGPTPTNPPPKP
jgi:N-acetylglucosamine-6-sulfatase